MREPPPASGRAAMARTGTGVEAAVTACGDEAHAMVGGMLAACERTALDAIAGRRDFVDEHGRLALQEGDFVAAISDTHGDYSAFKRALLATGLVDTSMRWQNERAALVVCGDIVDDLRVGMPDDEDDAERARFLAEHAFEGPPTLGTLGKPLRGVGTWRIVMTLNELAARGARIVALVGNHEAMRIAGNGYEPYVRRATLRYDAQRDGGDGPAGAWRPESVTRRLFNGGRLLAAASAGDVLFLHADVPRECAKTTPAQAAAEINGALARFVRARDDPNAAVYEPEPHASWRPTLEQALWGRTLGTQNNAAACDAIARFRGLVVRGHCPTRGKAPPGHGVRCFAVSAAARRTLTERTRLDPPRGARVSSPRASYAADDDADTFAGITLSCAAEGTVGKAGWTWHGRVLRIDCNASYAFDSGAAPAAVVLTFRYDELTPRVDSVFCVACGGDRPRWRRTAARRDVHI